MTVIVIMVMIMVMVVLVLWQVAFFRAELLVIHLFLVLIVLVFIDIRPFFITIVVVWTIWIRCPVIKFGDGASSIYFD